MLPISVCDSKEFKSFISSINSSYNVPCRQTMKTLVMSKFDSQKKVVKTEFEVSEAVALSFDEWTSVSTKTYLAITAHFLSGYELKERLICFVDMSGKTKSDSISTEI